MNIGKNLGTKLRTVLVIATSINTALMATDLTGFNNDVVDLIYKIASIICNFVIVGISTYFNNDYSEEACIHTGAMRQEKAEKKQDYVGDTFFDTDDDFDEGADIDE